MTASLNRVKKKEDTVNCGRMKTMEDVEMGKWELTNEEINARVKHEAFQFISITLFLLWKIFIPKYHIFLKLLNASASEILW